MNVLVTPPSAATTRSVWLRFWLSVLLCQPAAHYCQAAGTVMAWGANNAQQTSVPPGLTSVNSVAGGDAHSLALNSDGTVIGWGFNINGQATTPAGLNNVVAVSAGDAFSMGLRNNGTVVVWGSQSAAPSGLNNAVAIAAGADHCLALKQDGTVLAWGANDYGQTNVPNGLNNVMAIAAGTHDSFAMLKDGTVVAWGDNSNGKTTVPSGLSGIVAIAAGQDHCLAVTLGGKVVAWGADYSGQIDVPAGLSDVVAVAAGAAHSVALRSDGTLAAWGDNTYNQSVVSPTQAGFFAISAGAYHNLGLRSFGLPIILSQPQSKTIGIFNSAALQVRVVGTPPLAFQWHKNGTNLPGATTQALTLQNVQTNDAGAYSVTISNAFGVANSSVAILDVVVSPPNFISAPKSQTMPCGEPGALNVVAGGAFPISYQWSYEGAALPGATDSILKFNPVTTQAAGGYSVILSNQYGAVTSSVATLTVTVEPPLITSPLTASAKQGQPFSYAISALHDPTTFQALYLPAGLSLNPTTGVISGIPQSAGTFEPKLIAQNACNSSSATLALSVAPSIPRITSAPNASGVQGSTLRYTITATESPTLFGAQNLPPGLSVNPASGLISGTPVTAGSFDATITASNAWGGATAKLHFSIAIKPVTALSIGNVTYNYSSPYLLDFQFSLRDSDDPAGGNAVVVDPASIVVNGFEDDQLVSTNETSVLLRQVSAKVAKIYLVLDFTESIASLVNGDANTNGVSDAIDSMVAGAQQFVNQQPLTTQIGVYEFHREDLNPSNVVKLTSDKLAVNKAIAGIWTNYVQGYSAGSRCWDALVAALKDLGPTNADEKHYVVFVSDGRDESSLKATNDVINAATNANISIYCVGFGADLDTNSLQAITSATSGNYYTASNPSDLAAQFARIGNDFNGQYLLRWATLKRSSKAFMPSFSVSYAGLTANSPTNPWYVDTNNPIIDTNSTPPTTNYNNITNFIIGYFSPSKFVGDPSVGGLRLTANAAVQPTSVTLRTPYVPRYVTQIRLHYLANWPCTTSIQSTNPGGILAGWTMTETNSTKDASKWILLSSPNPQNPVTSLDFADFGNLINFNFRDSFTPSNTFSLFEVDNTIYTNTGKQSFAFDKTNLSSFVSATSYPLLPYGTPVPWLIAHGFPSNWQSAETNDVDGDGVLTWQEYQGNTDPQDKSSFFRIRSVTVGPDGRNQIRFTTAPNRTYQVDSSVDLITWQTVQNGVVGTGNDAVVADPQILLGAPEVYYRVRVY